MRQAPSRLKSRVVRWGRGALLFEVMLALTIFVGAGTAILAVVGQSTASLRATRDRQQAVDLARSAMAELEAGIKTADVLSGPVAMWRDELDSQGDEFEESGWELRVRTEPTTFDGLTLVIVTAARVGVADESPGSFTLRQLVRLSSAGEDSVGDVDDITKQAERDAARPATRPSTRPPTRPRGGPRSNPNGDEGDR